MSAIPDAGERPRRRRRGAIIAAAIVAGVLLLLVAAEVVARVVVDRTVAEDVERSLPSGTSGQIHADARGIVIPQLIRGRLDEVTLSSDRLRIGGVPVSGAVTAHDVPVNGSGQAHDVTGRIRLASGAVHTLSRYSPIFSRLTLVDGGVRLRGSASVLGYSIAYAAKGSVAVEHGGRGISITPESLKIDNSSLGVDVNDIPGVIGRPVSVCTADLLPKPVRLRSLDITEGRAVLRVRASTLRLGGSGLGATGACP